MVVGAGLMGASAAWHLARRGLNTVLLERFELNNQRGSSHGVARIFRLVYDIPEYVELARMALPLWREAERELGQDLLWTTGGLDIGPPEQVAALAHVLSSVEVPYQNLSARQLMSRFPFDVAADWEALFQPDGGVLHADACRLGLAELARRAGARIVTGTPVTSISTSRAGVSVQTATGAWDAEAVVLAAGSWANPLVEPLGLHVPLKVTREHVAYYRGPTDAAVVPFIFRQEPAQLHFYGLPNWRSGQVKVGINASGPEVNPDDDPVLDRATLQPIEDCVHRFLPSFGPVPESVETCLYASTPDDDFVMERVGPIILGIGFGGHGFKFGPAIGTLLADLVEGRAIPAATRFRYSRFAA